MKGLVYDILVGIGTSIAGGYIYAAVAKFFADVKGNDAPRQVKRR